MSQERYLELKAEIQSLGAGGFKKLSPEKQEEYQALKAEFGDSKPEKADDTVAVPKSLLEDLRATIAELKAARDLPSQPALPGQPVAVKSGYKEYKQQFKRFRDSAEDPWQYIVDVKCLKFGYDKDMEQKANIFKVTSLTASGEMKEMEIKDFDLARLGEPVLLKVTDRHSKEFEIQDRLTPTVKSVMYKDSANPKSVTGLEVVEGGMVKNMVRYLETYITVHIPADTDSDGREVTDTANAPAKLTYVIVDNKDNKGGVHLYPNSIKKL